MGLHWGAIFPSAAFSIENQKWRLLSVKLLLEEFPPLLSFDLDNPQLLAMEVAGNCGRNSPSLLLYLELPFVCSMYTWELCKKNTTSLPFYLMNTWGFALSDSHGVMDKSLCSTTPILMLFP